MNQAEITICRYCTEPVDNGIMICACAQVHENCRIIFRKSNNQTLVSDHKCDICLQPYLDNGLSICVDCHKENDDTSFLVCGCGSSHASCRKTFIKQNPGRFHCQDCGREYQDLRLENNINQTRLVKNLSITVAVILFLVAMITGGIYICGFFIDYSFFVLAVPLSLILLVGIVALLLILSRYYTLKKINQKLLLETNNDVELVVQV